MIKKFALLTLLVTVLLAFTILVSNQLQAKADPAGEIALNNWPPFTITYISTKPGDSGEPQTQLIKIIYEDNKHWRVEVLSNSLVPDVGGSWAEYDGLEIRHLDSRTGAVTINKDVPKDGTYIPEEWFRPSYIPQLLAQVNSTNKIDSSEGTGILTVTEYLRCQEELSQTLARAGLPPCAQGSNRIAIRQIKYRAIDFIPILIIDTLDGVEVNRITVTELVVGK